MKDEKEKHKNNIHGSREIKFRRSDTPHAKT
jgi:hypothetical protein